MKLKNNEINAQVRKLNPAFRAVLVYGRDEGLVRERATKIAHQIVEDLQDPFLVANIDGAKLKDEPYRLADEVAAISMMGGQRVIRVDGATDGVTGAAKSFLDNPVGDGLVVITAGGLTAKSSLVKLFTKAKNAALIPCYEDNQGEVQSLIFEVLGQYDLTIDPDAVAYLQANLGGDRMVSRSELEKLALYMGKSADGSRLTVTITDVKDCVGDSGTLTLDMIAEATTGGDLKALDGTLFKAFNRGESAIPILRNVARRLQKLHLVRGSMDRGVPTETALMSVVYNKWSPEKRSLQAQLGKWSVVKLSHALEIVSEAENSCKITGLPERAICARACLRIANAARSR